MTHGVYRLMHVHHRRPHFICFNNNSREQFTFTGIKDLIPQRKNDSYEGFEDLIDRCNFWLKERTDIVVINMQSVIVQKNDGKRFRSL